MNTLHKKAFGSLLLLSLAMAALLFIAAGTLDYWQAWMFLGVYFAASLALTLYLMKKDPKLLERRMRGGPTAEKEPAQKIIMTFASLGFIGLLLLPALDHRFGSSHMTPHVALAGDALVAIGWLAIFFVFRENSFTAATIELAPGQRVISTGPYALVRHPMYASGAFLLVGMSLWLESYAAALMAIVPIAILAVRILVEEQFLRRELKGYDAYTDRVRYRLIPFVW